MVHAACVDFRSVFVRIVTAVVILKRFVLFESSTRAFTIVRHLLQYLKHINRGTQDPPARRLTPICSTLALS